MGGQVVEEHVAGKTGLFCGRGLLARDFVEGNDDRRITASGVVKELTADLLDAADTLFVEKWRDVGGDKLCLLTVDRFGPGVWSVLRLGGKRMLECGECLGDVTRHGQVDISGCVVPVKMETEILRTCPVLGELVLGSKRSKEMIGIGLGEIFNSKVVDGKGEGGGACVVTPEAWGVRDRRVSIGSHNNKKLNF